jgi:hypothetical protein
MPSVCWSALALWIRALARGPAPRSDPHADAAARVLPSVRAHARALPGLDGPAPSRRRRSDRCGDRARRRRAGTSSNRPEGTVRGWLRAARARAQLLRAVATRQLVALDPEPGAVTPASCAFGDAVEAIMLAVRAWRLRFGPDRAGPWERAVCLTDGLLLPGSARRLARWPAPG